MLALLQSVLRLGLLAAVATNQSYEVEGGDKPACGRVDSQTEPGEVADENLSTSLKGCRRAAALVSAVCSWEWQQVAKAGGRGEVERTPVPVHVIELSCSRVRRNFEAPPPLSLELREP